MSDETEELRQQIAELESELRQLTHGIQRPGQRHRSQVTLFGLPLYDIALGPDPRKDELRGHAVGIIAIGDIATGVVAIGGIACGLFALGGVTFSLLLACGGVAMGTVTVGGVAIGAIALGGVAIGGFAVGGVTVSLFTVDQIATGHHAFNTGDFATHQINQIRYLVSNWNSLSRS